MTRPASQTNPLSQTNPQTNLQTNPLPPDPADKLQVGGVSLPRWRKIWLWVALAAGLIAPFMVGSYAGYQLTLALISASAIMGLTLLTGFNGQFSLGHSAFYAVGAYTAAILMHHTGTHYALTLLPAGIMCFIAGFLFGLPALRLDGLHLALATFALAIATPQLFKYTHFEGLTGGVQGLTLDVDHAFQYTDLEHYAPYFLSFIVLVILAWSARNLVNSRSGRAMIAIRDNPIAAKSMGVNTALYKALTFGVSGFFTGVAGALSAIAVKYVAPDSFTFSLAVLLLVGMVIGGQLSIAGAVFGGFFVLYLPNWAESLAELLGRPDAKALSWAVYGILLILAVYLMPSGAAGLAKKITGRLARPPGPDGPKGDLKALGHQILNSARSVLRLQRQGSIIPPSLSNREANRRENMRGSTRGNGGNTRGKQGRNDGTPPA